MNHTFIRHNQRAMSAMRLVNFQRQFTKYAEGSVLVSFGDTKVLCTASIIDKIPFHRKGKGGWLTAEYSMLPRATHLRTEREAIKGKQIGRTQEIQRLIGRSLRAILDMAALGEKTIYLDCDVLQADGGTRTAAINGAYIALVDAINTLNLPSNPIIDSVAAVSVGMVQGHCMCDLDYIEDSQCDVDMNVVMNGSGNIVEIQATAENRTFTRTELNQLLDYAAIGIDHIRTVQNSILNNRV